MRAVYHLHDIHHRTTTDHPLRQEPLPDDRVYMGSGESSRSRPVCNPGLQTSCTKTIKQFPCRMILYPRVNQDPSAKLDFGLGDKQTKVIIDSWSSELVSIILCQHGIHPPCHVKGGPTLLITTVSQGRGIAT